MNTWRSRTYIFFRSYLVILLWTMTWIIIFPPSVHALVSVGDHIVVRDAGDADDLDHLDNVCSSTAPPNKNTCTLRAAIQTANNSDRNHIVFELGSGVPKIILTSELPAITVPIIINGNTGGATRTEISGQDSGGTGFRVEANDSTLTHLVVNRFFRGIQLHGGNSKVFNCYLGTDANGENILSNAVGVFVVSDNNQVGANTSTGNLIAGSSLYGVEIQAAAKNNIVRGNLIGTNASGNGSLGNTGAGVMIFEASNNTIGGTHPSHRNIISGNNENGILINSSAASDNHILGNYIGLTKDGNAELGNQYNGIKILNGHDNTIGTSEAGAGNVISANHQNGIQISGISTQQINIQGNLIGTSPNGQNAMGNRENGVEILDSSENKIGGDEDQAGNLISGNHANGIHINGTGIIDNVIQSNQIGTNLNGDTAIPNSKHGIEVFNASRTQIGGDSDTAGNLISGNTKDGIRISGAAATENTVQGNLIGVTQNGTSKLSNGANGVNIAKDADQNEIKGPSQSKIGGAETGLKNIISGNALNGILLNGKGVADSNIQGNFVGTDQLGQNAIGNGEHGIRITNSDALGAPFNNIIGGIEKLDLNGPCQGSCNLISGNTKDGIHIDGKGISGNKVRGNVIGLNHMGNAALPNQNNGIFIGGSHSNTIGGLPQSATQPNLNRNIISGNLKTGVTIFGALAKGNEIFGNYIGTNRLGTQAMGNATGIKIEFTSFNKIGNNIPHTGNLISGNLENGIIIDEAHSSTIQGNRIGLQDNGIDPLANQGHGVYIANHSTANTVGGELEGQANHIAFNSGDGIHVSSLQNNEFSANSIHDNDGMGIDLVPIGVTLNDAGDSDLGANLLQNYPILSSIIPLTLEIQVEGTLDGLPNRIYKIQFFANESCDPSENGEGKFFLGSFPLESDDQGKINFSLIVPKLGGDIITATATDDGKNTSEFSPCRKIGTGPGVDFDLDNVLNHVDNCPNDSNPEQIDTDQDGVGDTCDLCPGFDDNSDTDNNQVPDCLEIFLHGAGQGCSLQTKTHSKAIAFPLWLLCGLAILCIRRWNFFRPRQELS